MLTIQGQPGEAKRFLQICNKEICHVSALENNFCVKGGKRLGECEKWLYN